jgi:hypothetical protein
LHGRLDNEADLTAKGQRVVRLNDFDDPVETRVTDSEELKNAEECQYVLLEVRC